MRIERLSIKGLLRFTDQADICLRDVPPGLIALTGLNGAGKSTVLEAAPAALYRSFLSRDSQLFDYATGRDSFLEVELACDGRGVYRARVNVDGVKRTTDAVLEELLPSGGRAVLNDGKATTFDAAVRDRFPSKDVLLASAFAAQNKTGSFITLEKKARKTLFSTLLGLDAYQTMSETARQAGSFTEQARGRLQVLVDELARATGQEVIAELDRVANHLQALGGDAEVRQRELRASISQLEARLAAVQDQAAKYDAAVARVKTLEADVATRRAERARVDVDRQTADATLEREIATHLAQRDQQLQDIANRLANNEGIKEKAADIRAAVAAIATIDQQLTDLDAVAAAKREEGEAGRAQTDLAQGALDKIVRTEQELQRVKKAAGLLDGVPCGGAGDFVSCQFLKDAAAEKARISELEAVVAGKPDAMALVETRRAAWQASKPAFDEAVAKIQQLRAERRTHETLAKYAEALAAAEARIAELEEQRVTCAGTFYTAERAAKGRRLEALDALNTRADELDAIIADLELQLAHEDTIRAVNTDGHARAVVVQSELGAARLEAEMQAAALARVEVERANLHRQRYDVEQKQVRLQDLQARIEQLTTDLLEWQTLTKALGRDGLPVLEIDAAGPTISSFTNQLLEECFGPRFSVDLVTQRAKADGKGFTDDFTIKVFDNVRGGDARDIADLSGGEQAILNEALMNGIGLYVNSRSTMPIRTAWRDETTGALDPENAVRYVQMLRKVLELGGYHQILFISHNPDAAALADAQLHVHDGRVDVVLPPFGQRLEAA